jgi:hypothetical protein
MKWRPLDSSVFTAAAYRRAKHILYLLFRSGELYCYFDFPPQDYREFLATDSKANTFHAISATDSVTNTFPNRLPNPES